jgi:four helix bundle protein
MRDRNARGGDIAERLLNLTAVVLRLTERLPRRTNIRHIAEQLARSVTSAGANYQEARHAESRADFIHKVRLAAKELSEALYWLRLLHALDLLPSTSPIKEADELVAILVASANTARRG